MDRQQLHGAVVFIHILLSCVLGCKVHRDYAAHAKQVVAENGDTVSGVLKKAMDAYLEEHGKPFTK